MDALITPGAANTSVDSALGVLVVLSLLVLVFEKAIATSVPVRGNRERSRCLDVGVFPLALGSVLIGLAYANSLLNPGS